MTYDELLIKKQISRVDSGFDIPKENLNQKLFPFQSFIVQRALKAGKMRRYGIGFELKESYFAQAKINCTAAVASLSQGELF